MKRLCLLFLLLIVGAYSRAQTRPNGPFETWDTAGKAPHWLSPDDLPQAQRPLPVPVAFGGTAPAKTAAAARFSVFPNPSVDGLFTLVAPDEPALLQNSLMVRDLAGRVVFAEPAAAPGTARRTVDLRGRPAGVYTLRLATPYGPVTRCVALQ